MLDGRTRRAFVADCARAAIALPLLPLDPRASDLQSLITDLEERLPALLRQAPTVPAVAMALVADAKILWRGAFGVTDFTSRTKVSAETIFEAGSVSKTVFAYAVLKACEAGLLGLDAPLTMYTPERLLADDPRLDLITARRVLSHTTGLPNWRSKQEPLAIHFTPGERWSYSGEGYYYLQSVLTRLAGHVDVRSCKTYDDGVTVCATDFDGYMKAHLLVPFSMKSSGYLYREGMARPHDEKGTMLADRKSSPIDAARYGSAGNLHTTVTDYARFLIEVIDPRPADRYRLGAAIRGEMLRPQVRLNDWLSWGLGWAIDRKSGGDIITHSGDNPGFKALTAASVGTRRGFIMLTNGDRGFDEIIVKTVASEPMQRFLPVTVNG